MSNRIVLFKPKYIFYFGSKKLRKRQNLGVIHKDLRKTFIVPDYVVALVSLVV